MILIIVAFQPKDMAAINERRKEFNQNNNQAMQSNQRYHADEVEERFAKYKPGVIRQDVFLLTFYSWIFKVL